MWPRQYAAEAVKLWLNDGRNAAIDYIDKECHADWKRLAWAHTVITMGLSNGAKAKKVQDLQK